jgi:rhamnulokinase
MKKTFLAFDLGASSGRGILGTIDNNKLELKEIHRFVNGPVEKDGELFWDINEIFKELKFGLKKALDECDEISGIAVDTWGVDYVLLKENGEFARLPYNYRDSRTDGVVENFFKDKEVEKKIYSKTGIQKMFFNTFTQLIAHKRQHPEDFKNAKLLFMPDALTYLFSDEIACEYTIASTSQLLNAKTKEWDKDVIAELGLPMDIFPKIVSPSTPSFMLKEELQKEFSCPPIPLIHVGSHDTASAVAAVPADKKKNWAFISCGTWALFGAEIDSPILSLEAMEAGYTNEGGLNYTIRFLSNINGTWLLQETRRTWKELGKDISFMDIEKMAADAPESKFTIDPSDDIFVHPGDMPSRVREYAAKHNLGELPDDASVVRCIYDSLAQCFADKLKELEKLKNCKFDCINIVGGGTKDDLLMQLTANRTGVTVISGPVEATAIGNIISQAIASGVIFNLGAGRDIVKNSFPVKEFQPEK